MSRHLMDQALRASREGRAFILKASQATTLSGGVVQTAAGTFKAIPVQDGVIQSMIAPAIAVTPIRASLQVDLGIDPADIHMFTLTPLVRNKQLVEEASLTVGPAFQPVFSG